MSSAPSLSKRGVKPLQFDPRIVGCELPVSFGVFPVALSLPGRDFAGMRRSRHCDDTTLSSLSAMLSQLPCLGV